MTLSKTLIKSSLEQAATVKEVTSHAMLSAFVLSKEISAVPRVSLVSGVIFVEKCHLIIQPEIQLDVEIVAKGVVRPAWMLRHTADLLRSKLKLARLTKHVAFVRLTVRESYRGRCSTELGPLGPTGSQIVVACIDYRSGQPRIAVYNPTGPFPYIDFNSLLKTLGAIDSDSYNQNFQADQSCNDPGLGALFCHRVLYHWLAEVKNNQKLLTFPVNPRSAMLTCVAESFHDALNRWPELETYADHL